MTLDKQLLDGITDRVMAYKKPRKPYPASLDLQPPPLIIEHHRNDVIIGQRSVDGYIDATDMCKKSGKELGKF